MKLSVTRLIASLTVLMLLAVNFLPSLKMISYALEGTSEEVTVSGNFQVGDGELADSASLDVGEQDGKIVLDVKVNGKGYLKSGTFNFDGTENFQVKENSDVEVNERKVKVKVVDSDNPDHIVLPIEFKTKAEYDQNYFRLKQNMIKTISTRKTRSHFLDYMWITQVKNKKSKKILFLLWHGQKVLK